MEAGDQAAPFFQQWRRDVDGGEGGVNLQLPAGLGLQQLLGTLLVRQLRWGVRRRLLLHLQLLPLLLLLSLSRFPLLNFLSPLFLFTEFSRGAGCGWRGTGRALVWGKSGHKSRSVCSYIGWAWSKA